MPAKKIIFCLALFLICIFTTDSVSAQDVPPTFGPTCEVTAGPTATVYYYPTSTPRPPPISGSFEVTLGLLGISVFSLILGTTFFTFASKKA